MPSGESPAQTRHNSAVGGLGKHCRTTEVIPAFTSLHLASPQVPLQGLNVRMGRGEAGRLLPPSVPDTDLSAALGLGDGCYIGQRGFLCTLLSAPARLGLRLQHLPRQVIPYQGWVSARAPKGPSCIFSFHTPAQLRQMTGKEYAIILLLSKPESAI